MRSQTHSRNNKELSAIICLQGKTLTIRQIHDEQSVCNITYISKQVFFHSFHNNQTNSVSVCVGFVCVCVSCRVPGANVSVTCYKLTSLLPWTPSVEKYKWATKKGERGRERESQTDREREVEIRWGTGEPLHEYKGISSPPCARHVISAVSTG